jgi:xanthine dehydrogenase accessory factor
MITEKAGSTPRDTGAWILVDHEEAFGTLGGGQLEKMVEEEARKLLCSSVGAYRSIIRYVLGPDANQCCGGTVALALELLDARAATWLEKAQKSLETSPDNAILFPTNDPNAPPRIITMSSSISVTTGTHLQSLHDPRPWLFLFGAGHVGRSICNIASQLPLRLVALDQRNAMRALVPPARNVTVIDMVDSDIGTNQIPDGAAALVMTHSHELDYLLCRALLEKPGLIFIGLIGSHSKAARFRHRFRRDGVDPLLISNLTSPIGENNLSSKEPGVIALSTLTEIMIAFENTNFEKHAKLQFPSGLILEKKGQIQ